MPARILMLAGADPSRERGSPVNLQVVAALVAASIERGQHIFQASCAGCHGITGRGDEPDGRFIQPRLADLRVHMAAGHTDQEFFDWLSNRVAGTAMLAFSGSLTEEER